MRRLVLVLAAVAGLSGCSTSGDEAGDGAGTRAGAAAEKPSGKLSRTVPDVPQPREKPGASASTSAKPVPVRRMGALLDRRVSLHRKPGGAFITNAGRRTKFGGRQVVAVVARQGDWLGVLHQSSGLGRRAAWVRADRVRLLKRRYEIVVDRSALRGTLLRDGRVVKRFRVGAGRRGNATPLGRYAITDRIIAGNGSPYGCCILALTGRQPSLPQGWAGGDRLALHGGPARRVGVRVTSGCVTVGERDLRRIFARVTAGTRVTVRA